MTILFNKTITTMNKITFGALAAYESPLCEVAEMDSEGVLCSSLQQLEDGGHYPW